MPEKFEDFQQYRDDLAERLKQEKDKEKRREMLDGERETLDSSRYWKARDAVTERRYEDSSSQERQRKEREKDEVRSENIRQIEVLKFKLESEIEGAKKLTTTFFSAFTGEVDESRGALPLATIEEKTKELRGIKESPREYIERGAVIFKELRRFKLDIKTHIESSKNQQVRLVSDKERLEGELRVLEGQGWWDRLRSRSKISERRGMVSRLGRRIDEVDEEIRRQEKELKDFDLNPRFFFLADNMASWMRVELDQNLSKRIGNLIDELRGKFVSDLFSEKEVGDTFIDQKIRPVLDGAVKEGTPITHIDAGGYSRRAISQREADQLIENARSYIMTDNREALKLFNEAVGSGLDLDPSHMFRYYRSHKDALTSMLACIFHQYVDQKIQDGIEHLKLEKEKLDSKRDEEWIRLSQIYSDRFGFPRSFGGFYFSGHYDPALPHLQSMPFWAATRDAPLVQQTFAETAKDLDNRFFEKSSEASLSDQEGQFIDSLVYFPRPDSVKTLALIATADFANYRTVHARAVLEEFTRRPDWLQVLGEAEKKYPALKEIRPLLETWRVRGDAYEQNAEFTGKAADLAISLIKDEPDNWPQVSLALQAIPNERLIGILEPRGAISKEQAELIKEALQASEAGAPGYSGYFHSYLRKILRDLWEPPKDLAYREVEERDLKSAQLKLEQLTPILKKIVESQGAAAFKFLASREVIEGLERFGTNAGGEKIDQFLSAYEHLPELSNDPEFLKPFCLYFEGRETVSFYQELIRAYRQVDAYGLGASVAEMVGRRKLDGARGLSLFGPIETERGQVNFSSLDHRIQMTAKNFPETFIETNDGLDFLDYLDKNKGIENLDSDLESTVGARLKNSDVRASLKSLVANLELEQIHKMFEGGKIAEVDRSNWKGLLMGFIGLTEDLPVGAVVGINRGDADQIKKLFENKEARDVCFSEIRKLWLEYLERGKEDEFPVSLSVIGEYIKFAGGAGPLSQIGSVGEFMNAYVSMLSREGTAPRTKKEIFSGLSEIERRFAKDRWSNEEVTDFYNIAKDVLDVAPSLLSEYFELFKELKPKDFKKFSLELFPVHRVILSLMARRGERGMTTYNKKDLIKLRRYVSDVAKGSEGLKTMEVQRKELTDWALLMFKDRFGVSKIPENLTSEHVRTMTDISMYLSNLTNRNEYKENLLSFFLALNLNNKWEGYRQGEEIDPQAYLVPEKATEVAEYLERRERLNPVTAENLGIDEKKMPEFMKVLQEESESVVIGDVQTVDVKLSNVVSNLRGLEDLDLYPDPMDKERMRLLLEHGNKRIGAVAAKMYQSLASPGKQIGFSEDEERVRKEIEAALARGGFELAPESVKKHFQEDIKPLSVVANVLGFTNEIGVDREIGELREALKPSGEVIEVFGKMGEEFKPTSGAIAISQDLDHLDNLIVKKTKELPEEEVKIVKSYLDKVREKLVILENIYDQIEKKFASLRQGQAETKNELLRVKLDEISKIIEKPDSRQMVVSTMTHHLPYIIENMRACLACVNQGVNNDTNLTFGDTNKFYLYSRSEVQAKSISDEVVFFEPVELPDGTKGMAFVLDRVYGTNTPSILMNQIEAVYKKFAKIHRSFPEAKVSVLVSADAAQAGGMSRELLVEKLQEKLGRRLIIEDVREVEVDVAESAAEDHYIEFGGDARTAGKRKVNGVLIQVL